MTKVLQGKTALVTGASRGLGRATAQKLAASGALVAINYATNEEAAHETLASIEAKGGQGFLIRKVLGTSRSAEELAAALDAELTKRTGDPGLDILVNNVGGGVYATIDQTTPEIYETTVSNNMGATFWVTRAVKPRLRQNGRVINLGSEASRIALKDVCVYTMCKAAVNVFTVMMAKELGSRRITVNCLMPGFLHTDVNDQQVNDPEIRKHFEQNTLIGRIGEPDDLASVAHDLATPAWGFVTGQIIEVSGGLFL